MANQPRARRQRLPRFDIPPSKLLFQRLNDPPRQHVVQQLAHNSLQLQNFGGKTITDLTYQPVFLGEAWQSGLLRELGGKLTTHLARAMESPELNKVFKQYFNGHVSAKPLDAKLYLYVGADGHADVSWKPYFYGEDIQHTIAFLHGQGALPRDLANSAVLLLLAPGTILFKRNDPSGTDVSTGFTDSMGGLASYHHYVDLGKDRVYYAVSVWSDGENGAAIPGWQPWESTCAGVYHELAETRTNPNITGEIPTDKIWGWASSEGEEIGDLSLDWAGDDPTQVFKRDLPRLDGVPVELLWSNAIQQPYMPPPESTR